MPSSPFRPLLPGLVLALLVVPASARAAAPDLVAPASARAGAPELVVRFKSTTGDAAVARSLRATGVTATSAGPGGTRIARLRPGADARAAVRALRARSSVAWASRSFAARVAAIAPNDTGVAARGAAAGGWAAEQWDFAGPFGIRAPEAWELAIAGGTPGGKGITVAVLDTGVAYADRGAYRRSPDLPASRIVRGHDFVAGDNYPNDANGHGTFVASTIAAAADNGYGMVGVAYDANIMPVRVLDQYGQGSSYRVSEGIRYAAAHGARVINVSIELTDDSGPISLTSAPDIREALRYARSRGAVVVAAAGNSAVANVPARKFSSLLVQVGGSTEHGCVADYSNYGAGLDLLAPGGGADAFVRDDPDCRPEASDGRTIAQITFHKQRPGRFLVPHDYEGTSMAAPHVSGVVALLLGARTIGARPSPGAVKRLLTSTARDLGPAGPDRYYGAGLLDAARALGGAAPAPPAAPPAAAPPAPAA